MKWGTTCVKHASTRIDVDVTNSAEPYCSDMGDCSQIDEGRFAEAAAGTTIDSDTWYSDVKYFEGTCDDPHPGSCDDRERKDDCDACQYDRCCAPVALCEDDPNCGAIVDCVLGCKNDQACARRCVSNGETNAREHFSAAMKCITETCTDRC